MGISLNFTTPKLDRQRQSSFNSPPSSRSRTYMGQEFIEVIGAIVGWLQIVTLKQFF